MSVAPDTERPLEKHWRIIAVSNRWNPKLRDRILNLVEQQAISPHPQTLQLRHSEEREGEVLFLKVFHGARGFALVKDMFRQSKAFRSLRQGLALAEAGFNVPVAVAAGEERRFGLLRKAFFVTLAVDGEPVPKFLERHLTRVRQMTIKQKRESLKGLARQIQRLHELGFVHGDLVPTNIQVTKASSGWRFTFMDNDRTRRYPSWLPQRLWRRNLVQLNRFSLPGISLQDRMRFFREYVGGALESRKSLRLLRWLEKKTRRRLQEWEVVDPKMSFRQLMRWEEEPDIVVKSQKIASNENCPGP